MLPMVHRSVFDESWQGGGSLHEKEGHLSRFFPLAAEGRGCEFGDRPVKRDGFVERKIVHKRAAPLSLRQPLPQLVPMALFTLRNW
jgi:hypothetical protein